MQNKIKSDELAQGTVLTVPYSLPRGEGGISAGNDERGITGNPDGGLP